MYRTDNLFNFIHSLIERRKKEVENNRNRMKNNIFLAMTKTLSEKNFFLLKMLLSLSVLIANNHGVVATSTLMCFANLDKNIQFAT